jgi:iron complex transport system substrate-binding protein
VRIIVTLRLLLLAMLAAFAIVTCSRTANNFASNSDSSLSQSPSADCRIIEHALGKTQVCGQPQRIVALGPNVLESLLALDVQPAGFADPRIFHKGNYDNPNQQIPYLGSRVTSQPANVGLAFKPSLEAILKVQPDLILGTEYNASQYEALSKIAPTLLLKLFDAKMIMRTIAKAVRRSEKAEQLLTETEQKIAAARETFAPVVAAHPNVLLLSLAQLQNIYLGAIAHGHCSSLIEDLGFQLVLPPKFKLEKSQQHTPVSISLETLPQLNDADWVILLGSNFSELNQPNGTNNFEERQLSALKEVWKKNAIAQSLKASKAGRVYFITSQLCLGLPGPIGTELYLNELRQQLLSPS